MRQRSKVGPAMFPAISQSIIDVKTSNSNCQGELKLLRVIGASSYRGFEQKDQKHLIKVVLCLYLFYCKISSNVRAYKTTSTVK